MMLMTTTTTKMIMMMIMIKMIQQKFDTLSQTWPPQQEITHNLGINPAAALDWVSSLEGFPLSPHPKNDISLLCLVNITNHILRHKVTFSSSNELACFSSSTLLALVNSATRLWRSLDFSNNCWISFSLASISSCFFWVSCLEAFAWFCNFSSRLVRSFVFDLKKGHDITNVQLLPEKSSKCCRLTIISDPLLGDHLSTSWNLHFICVAVNFLSQVILIFRLFHTIPKNNRKIKITSDKKSTTT